MQVLSPNREANRQAPPPRDDRPPVPSPRATPSQGSKLALDASAKPRRTGLQLPVSLPFDTWRRIGHQISLIADSSAWWLGDWLVYGENEYTDRYKRAVEESSLDIQTLRNYAWVARRFPVSRRRDRLSLQHHAEVAALPEHEQTLWLDRAERFNWSRNRLRSQIKAHRAAALSGRTAETARQKAVIQIDVPADQEQSWRDAARRMNRSVEEWARLILNQVATGEIPVRGVHDAKAG
ncbi:LmbU family transcriptional regulator [Streptosporangium amethystogenes subsp. fukuiense]|uniref:LmbU family transcriptional regulator n=1 Tax=Streptosporangium amethystogenes subsp. fukuiense TaxID=698418 RepID=A0ABW2SWK5_9ACTN